MDRRPRRKAPIVNDDPDARPTDPDLIRIQLAEARTAAAFRVFAQVTNGPGLRARVIEYSTLVLGAVFGAAGAVRVVAVLEIWLPTWASLLLSVPFLLLGFLGALTASLSYLGSCAFGFATGRQWTLPLALLFLAALAAGAEGAIGPWWALAGFWGLLVAAMFVSTTWAAPAIGRDIELHHAVDEWSQPPAGEGPDQREED